MGKKNGGGREERKPWDEIWLGVLSLQLSNHGLGNIILDKKSERRRKERWAKIWPGVLSLQLSNHGLSNTILIFEPLREKALQELLSRHLIRRELRYIEKHCHCQPFKEKIQKLLEQTKKPTRRVVKI